jgi:hypothetical protein
MTDSGGNLTDAYVYMRLGASRAQCVDDADSARSRMGESSSVNDLSEFESQLSREVARFSEAV